MTMGYGPSIFLKHFFTINLDLKTLLKHEHIERNLWKYTIVLYIL